MIKLQSIHQESQKRLAVFGIGIIITAFVLYGLYNALIFHATSTTPSMDNFPVITPVIVVSFNKQLNNSVYPYITWQPAITSASSIQGKQLTIDIKSPLQEGTQYTLTIKNVISSSGQQIQKLTYHFSPQNIAFQELPPSLQQEIIKRQDRPQPSRNTIIFLNTDSLLNIGISSMQIDAMKQAVFLYGQSMNAPITQATINSTSIQAVPRDPESSSPVFSVTFTITIDNTIYNAQLDYSNLTTARLRLYNSITSQQVYDSGTIDDSQIQ